MRGFESLILCQVHCSREITVDFFCVKKSALPGKQSAFAIYLMDELLFSSSVL